MNFHFHNDLTANILAILNKLLFLFVAYGTTWPLFIGSRMS